MGNKGSSTEKKANRDHNHPRLTKATELRKDGLSFIQAVFTAKNKEEYKNWADRLEKPPADEARCAFLPVKHTAKSGGMCGDSKSIHADYPDYWYVLADEIKNRKKINTQITESELWTLLADLANVTAHYHRNNMKVGDIRPENVLLNEAGRAAAITQHSFPDELTNYERTLRTGEKTYLAPEEVQ